MLQATNQLVRSVLLVLCRVMHDATWATSAAVLSAVRSPFITRREAVASPSTGFTLSRISTMFTRSAITPPEVNGFG